MEKTRETFPGSDLIDFWFSILATVKFLFANWFVGSMLSLPPSFVSKVLLLRLESQLCSFCAKTRCNAHKYNIWNKRLVLTKHDLWFFLLLLLHNTCVCLWKKCLQLFGSNLAYHCFAHIAKTCLLFDFFSTTTTKNW